MNRTFPQRARGAKENISAGAVRGVTNPDRGSDLYSYIGPVSRPHTDHAGYLYDGIIWIDFAHHDLSLLVIENSPARVLFSPEVILLPVSASGMAMKSRGDTTFLPVPACEKAARIAHQSIPDPGTRLWVGNAGNLFRRLHACGWYTYEGRYSGNNEFQGHAVVLLVRFAHLLLSIDLSCDPVFPGGPGIVPDIRPGNACRGTRG